MREPQVESYRFGHMVVDGEEHRKDVILLPDRVIANWWRGEGHRLSVDDLAEVFDAGPEVLVVGTGAQGVMEVPEETRRAVREAGMELEIARTGEAWQLYNERQRERAAAGAFHLTC